jgi:anti-repressor protein
LKLVFIENSRLVTDSVTVSETFGKRHADVLRSIENLECSQEFIERNFALNEYQDSIGRKLPKYLITQDGFSFLVMGYTGKEAARFKEMYIGEFNRMREELNKPQFQLPQTWAETLRLLADEMESNAIMAAEKEKLAIETAEQKQKLKEQEAPVAIYNLAISAHNSMSMQEVAKSLGTGRTRLFNILREEKVLMRGSTMPYQRFLDAGYFKVTERPRASGDTIINDPATRVTAKGFDYIARIMQKRGVTA